MSSLIIKYIIIFSACYVQAQIKNTCSYKNIGKEYIGMCSSTCTSESLIAFAKLKTPLKFCEDNQLICCLMEEFMNENMASEPEKNTMLDKKCEEYSEKVRNMKPSIQDKISDGVNASQGEFPHMAALGYGIDENIMWGCGGSLISEQYVLTAAHCLKDDEIGEVMYVHLGNVELPRNALSVYRVTERIQPNDYKKSLVYNDIGLLKLNKPVKFSAYIKPACVYKNDINDINMHDKIATGWGMTEFGMMSGVLQKVKLEIPSDSFCKENTSQLVSTSERSRFKGLNISSQLCAVGKSYADTCQGDSGGPLQFYNFYKNIHYVVGITSFGPKWCGQMNAGVYTKVSHYIKWIEIMVWPEEMKNDKPIGSNFFNSSSRLADNNFVEYPELGNKTSDDKFIDTDVKFGEFSHNVAIGYGNIYNKVEWACGGALISEKFILTAAQCKLHPTLNDAKYVQLGSTTLFKKPYTYHLVTNIFVHPKYTPSSKLNDIALIEIPPVEFGINTRPISLSTEKLDKKQLISTGWGLGRGKKNNILKKVKLELIHDCKSKYPSLRDVSETQMCAGSSNNANATCVSDFGGPLYVYSSDKKLYLVGVASPRYNSCGISGAPAVYTKVSNFIPWIVDTVWPTTK